MQVTVRQRDVTPAWDTQLGFDDEEDDEGEDEFMKFPGMGGSSPTAAAAAAGSGGVNGSVGGSCCDMSLRCWCRWRCREHPHCQHRSLSSGLLFFLGCFVVYGSLATLYAWLVFTPPVRPPAQAGSMLGCQEDNEGSWSVGVFYGDSPFSLKSIETVCFLFVSFPASVFYFLPPKNDWFSCVWEIGDFGWYRLIRCWVLVVSMKNKKRWICRSLLASLFYFIETKKKKFKMVDFLVFEKFVVFFQGSFF